MATKNTPFILSSIIILIIYLTKNNQGGTANERNSEPATTSIETASTSAQLDQIELYGNNTMFTARRVKRGELYQYEVEGGMMVLVPSEDGRSKEFVFFPDKEQEGRGGGGNRPPPVRVRERPQPSRSPPPARGRSPPRTRGSPPVAHPYPPRGYPPRGSPPRRGSPPTRRRDPYSPERRRGDGGSPPGYRRGGGRSPPPSRGASPPLRRGDGGRRPSPPRGGGRYPGSPPRRVGGGGRYPDSPPPRGGGRLRPEDRDGHNDPDHPAYKLQHGELLWFPKERGSSIGDYVYVPYEDAKAKEAKKKEPWYDLYEQLKRKIGLIVSFKPYLNDEYFKKLAQEEYKRREEKLVLFTKPKKSVCESICEMNQLAFISTTTCLHISYLDNCGVKKQMSSGVCLMNCCCGVEIKKGFLKIGRKIL